MCSTFVKSRRLGERFEHRERSHFVQMFECSTTWAWGIQFLFEYSKKWELTVCAFLCFSTFMYFIVNLQLQLWLSSSPVSSYKRSTPLDLTSVWIMPLLANTPNVMYDFTTVYYFRRAAKHNHRIFLKFYWLGQLQNWLATKICI